MFLHGKHVKKSPVPWAMHSVFQTFAFTFTPLATVPRPEKTRCSMIRPQIQNRRQGKSDSFLTASADRASPDFLQFDNVLHPELEGMIASFARLSLHH